MTTINLSQVASKILSDAQRVDTMGTTVSSKLIDLYKQVNDVTEFTALCEEAQADWKVKRIKAKEDTALPRVWVQTKSDIIGAVKLGIDITPMETISQIKKAKNEASKAAKQATASGINTSEGAESTVFEADMTDVAISQVQKLLDLLSSMNDTLRATAIDSFISQARHYIAADEEQLGAEIARIEAHLQSNAA